MARVGTLRDRIAIQTRDSTPLDTDGQPPDTWTTVANVAGERTDVTGRSETDGQAENSVVATRVRIRRRAGLVPKHTRVVINGTETLGVDAILVRGTRREWLLLVCEQNRQAAT